MLAFMAGPSDSSCSPTAFLRLTYVRFFSSIFHFWPGKKISAFFNFSQYFDDLGESAHRKPSQARAPFTTRLQSSTRPSMLAFILLLLFLLLAVVSLPLLSPQEHAAPSSRTLVLRSAHGTNVKLSLFTPCLYVRQARFLFLDVRIKFVMF